MGDTEVNIRDGQQKKKIERRTSKKKMPSPRRQKRRRNFVSLNRHSIFPPPSPAADSALADHPSAPRGQGKGEEEDPLRASSETEPQRKRRNKGQLQAA